jgi:uncharacterized membrane protein YtjA (UPF0391 family)
MLFVIVVYACEMTTSFRGRSLSAFPCSYEAEATPLTPAKGPHRSFSRPPQFSVLHCLKRFPTCGFVLACFFKNYYRRLFDNPKNQVMLRWTVIFLIVAIIAAIFGFGGIAAGAAGIAKVLFFIFLVLFILSLIFGRSRSTL